MKNLEFLSGVDIFVMLQENSRLTKDKNAF